MYRECKEDFLLKRIKINNIGSEKRTGYPAGWYEVANRELNDRRIKGK